MSLWKRSNSNDCLNLKKQFIFFSHLPPTSLPSFGIQDLEHLEQVLKPEGPTAQSVRCGTNAKLKLIHGLIYLAMHYNVFTHCRIVRKCCEIIPDACFKELHHMPLNYTLSLLERIIFTDSNKARLKPQSWSLIFYFSPSDWWGPGGHVITDFSLQDNIENHLK